jgi:hypothetical protein
MKSLYLFCILILVNANLQATTVTLSGETVFESDENSPLSGGSYVSVGYFTDGFDFDTIPSLTWSNLLSTSYNEISGSFTINPAGNGAGIGSQTNIFGESLFVWFFDTTNMPVLILDQEFGLFSSSSLEWTAKGDSVSDFNSLVIEDIDIVEYGSIVNGGVSLAPVPEPSTYALFAGVLAFGYIVIRRSRSQA